MAEFQKPDLSKLPVIQQMKPQDLDAYHRVVAAGMKMMYSPATAQERQEALQSKEPIAKKLATNTTGLMLMLDQKSRGGIPGAALFPAALDLMGEAATIFIQGGQPVSQEDFNDASLMLFSLLGKKTGASNDQLMQGAEQALQNHNGGATEQPQAQPQPQAGRQIGMLGTGGAQ